MEKIGLDSGHSEGDGFDCVGCKTISSCKFHVLHVQNLLGQEDKTLMQARRTIRRQGEQMGSVQGHFKGCHGAFTLPNEIENVAKID